MRYPSFEKFSSENDIARSTDRSCAVNNITHVAAELFWCMGPLSTMEKLLSACPRLEIFKFIIPDRARYKWLWNVAYEPLVAPRELVTALLWTHWQSLQALYLDFHHHYSLGVPELLEEIERREDCVYTYPSFRDSKSLTHMAIEFEKLVNLQDLPSSLEQLELHHCHFVDLDQAFLAALVWLKSKWCPRIDSVILCGLETADEGMNVVRSLASLLGILVQLTGHGRVLTILEGGYYLKIKSLTLLHNNVPHGRAGHPGEPVTFAKTTSNLTYLLMS